MSTTISRKRGFIRRQITDIYNFCQLDISTAERTKILTKITKLKSLQIDIKDYNDKILEIDFAGCTDDSKWETELSLIDDYNDKVIEALLIMEGAVATVSPNTNISQNLSTDPSNRKLRPPVAPLPSYSGSDGESLDQFLVSFEAVVGNYDYSSYEKFILLKQQLSGRASIIIKSLETNKQSYEDAKNLLTLALASPNTQRFDAMQRLINLKMNSTADPYVFASEVRVIQESFKNLKIDTDFVLQFFIWRSMNDT